MYHRVITEKELEQQYVQPGMYVKEVFFDLQMAFLKENFEIISFKKLLALWENRIYDESKRYCIITFDDGWLDNYLYAFPVLKRYQIPATIFLPTSFIGTDHWFWPDQIGYLLKNIFLEYNDAALHERMQDITNKHDWLKGLNLKDIDSVIAECKKMPDETIGDLIDMMEHSFNIVHPKERLLVNWHEIEEMSNNDISFGSHSCSHKILTKYPISEIQAELKESMRMLQGEKGNFIPVFCYPNGNYNTTIENLVKDAGYKAAVSTKFGYEADLPDDLFSLKRIGVHNDISKTIPLFTLNLSGLIR